MSINIIGDVAGEYKTLQALLGKMPKADLVVLLGDLNDRGPNSKEVIEWAMSTSNVLTIHSNHGQMLVDYYKAVETGDYNELAYKVDFYNNGGKDTLLSYDKDWEYKSILDVIPKEHINWLDTRPITYINDSLVCSHAPRGKLSGRYNMVWNRGVPIKTEGMFSVFGHNSHWGLRYFEDYAVCIDTSQQRILTGMHWPNKTIYQQEYV